MKNKVKNMDKETLVNLRKKYSKTKEAIWKDIAERLETPRRKRASVNLDKINKIAKENANKIIIVPGKVLGVGTLEGKTKIAALSFSEKALKEIKKNGEALLIDDVCDAKYKGKDFIIVK